MKLLSLDLLAYGPFTARRLDFSSPDTAFHVVFGRNEAGKSSSLRALHALFYGVPERTDDTFLHDSAQLRIGGRVLHSDGRELAFRRRKGRKKTLLDVNDAPIDDGSLAAFLAGVDGARFEGVFGIDHERLASGAQAILSGGGDVGESLFGAGVGTSNLREVLGKLDAEADALYKSRGSRPTINTGLAAYKATTKKVRELTVVSSAWSTLRKKQQKLREEQAQIAGQQRELNTTASRLGRLQKVLPKLGLRRELLAELEPLGGVVILGAEFIERRRSAEEQLRQSQKSRAGAEGELAKVHERVAGLEIPEGLLREQVAVNALYKDLGSFRKAEADATKLSARRAQSRADAHVLLDGLRPDVSLDDVDRIRLKVSTKARVRELAEKFQAIDVAPAHARRDVKRCERELQAAREAREQLADPRDVAPLRKVVERLRKRGDVEASRREAVRALAGAQEEAALALSGLGSWTGTAAEVEALAVPTLETVERHHEALQRILGGIDENEAALRDRARSLADQDQALEELRLAGAVLTEADLDQARARRTQGWSQIRRAWLGGEEVGAPSELASDHEACVEQADEVADRLRREAERVARFAAIQAHRVRLVGEIGQLERRREAAREAAEAQRDEWTGLWAPLGIAPLSPREMRGWLTRYDHVVVLARSAREAARRLDVLDTDIAGLRTELSAALLAVDEPALGDADTLDASLERAQRVIDTVAEVGRRRGDLEQGVPALEKALEAARDLELAADAERDAWRVDWAGPVADLGLHPTASPAEANAVLDKLIELFEKVDEARSFEGRLKGIERDAQAFRDQLALLVGRAAPDLQGRPADHAVEELHARLAAAKQDAAKLQQLQQRVDELGATIDASEQERMGAERDLRALCDQAGCAGVDDLATAERQSDHRRSLEQRVATIDEQLAEHGGIDALIAEAEAVDADALPAEIEENGRKLKELDATRTELDQRIGRERAEFERIDGSDQAAEEAARAQGQLAKLGADVDRYVRVRLAADLLRREIERYREANQAPLLTRAGQIFSALTLGSFSDLRADFDDKDEPVLVGVRPSDERVGVSGMSDGTADQLYLSIRLATLEHHLATHEPIPFVVDDILVHFDDERALAALQVLAALSRKTQVLFFTHHARLVELAARIEGRVQVHEL